MTSDTAPRTTDVVVIGGGIIGCSIAYHLAERGCRNVVICEKASLGSGSTSKAPGGIRYSFEREIEVRLAIESFKFWQDFDERTGGHLGFRRIGYLILLNSADAARRAGDAVAMQRRLGVDSRLLTPAEVTDIVPEMNVDGLLGATWCPADGRGVPSGAVEGYVRQARQLGVRFVEGVEVRAIRTAGGRVIGIETSAGPIATPVVVNAAGPDAADVGAMVGVEVPVHPQRRSVFVTGPFAGRPDPLPYVQEAVPPYPSIIAIAPEGPGVLVSVTSPEPSSKNTSVDWTIMPDVIGHAAHRLPGIAGAALRATWAGSSEPTPDKLPIVGRVPEVTGFICACGLSGHGIMFSPAIGRLTAEIILDGAASTMDTGELSIGRFRK